MPCRDYYDDHPEAYFRDVKEPALKNQIAFAESALCQALAALEHLNNLLESHKKDDFYAWLNYKDAGITKSELIKWHKNHRRLDALHREQERIKKVKESALAKLSEEEKKVLGFK